MVRECAIVVGVGVVGGIAFFVKCAFIIDFIPFSCYNLLVKVRGEYQCLRQKEDIYQLYSAELCGGHRGASVNI